VSFVKCGLLSSFSNYTQ